MKPLIKDKGLEQYPSVRDAYNSAKEILKKENPDRKELSGLLGILEKNPEGVVWLKLEEGENYKSIFSRLYSTARLTRSRDILENIEKCFLLEGGLYSNSLSDGLSDEYAGYTSTGTQGAMAILHSVLGDYSRAEEILELYEAKIKNKARLYRHSDKGNAVMTSDNALIATAYASVGNRNKADEIFDAIESKCGKIDEAVYFLEISSLSAEKVFCLEPNASMAIAHRILGIDGRANAIMGWLESLRMKNSRMYHMYANMPEKGIKFDVDRRFLETGSNGMMAFAHLIEGRYENGQAVLEEIEQRKDTRTHHYAHVLNGSATFGIGEPHVWAKENAIIAIAYALMDGAKLCGLPKREKP